MDRITPILNCATGVRVILMGRQAGLWGVAIFASLIVTGVLAQTPLIIDTHAHLDNPGPTQNFRPYIDAAIRRMDAAGIRRSILLPPPQTFARGNNWELEAIRSARERFPDRIALAGGGGSLNGMIQDTPADAVTEAVRRKFRERAEELIVAGAVAFGEITAHHLSLSRMGPNHPYEWVPPDHPLLLLLADIAAEKGVPIDLHLDLVPEDMPLPARPIFNTGTTPAVLKANQPAFERLLAHNRKANIIWAHAGADMLWTRTVAVQAQLLERHPNLYMSLRLNNGGQPPVIALDRNLTIKPSWMNLLRRFPDRFVFGSDSFHAPEGARQRGPSDEGLETYRIVMSQLPQEVAEAIGHGNAERLFRLKRD